MKRFFWVALLGAAIVGGALLVRGLGQLAQQTPKAEHVVAGTVAGAPLRMVRLYFGAPGRVALIPEERAIVDPGGPEKLAEAIATEVFKGSARGTGVAGLDPATRVRAFYLAPDGTGYLDLSGEFLEQWPQGDGLEWVSLGSLVRSISENVPGVRSVYILVEGTTIERSPGSIPLDLPLEPDGFGGTAEGAQGGGGADVETDL
jgi:hypothetical protein